MTDKEVKRLTRPQLIEIIYQLQLREDQLTAENQKLSQMLEDRRIMLEDAGDVAKAAMEIHKVMQAAQEAADHYLEEMQARANEEYNRIIAKANAEAAAILAGTDLQETQQAEQQTEQEEIPQEEQQAEQPAQQEDSHCDTNVL